MRLLQQVLNDYGIDEMRCDKCGGYLQVIKYGKAECTRCHSEIYFN